MEGAFRSGTTLVGKYRIDSLLGRDGMCLVFSAIHLQTGQPVLLKLLVPETVTSLAVHARFLREAQSVARLCGEHVARLIDVGILPEGVPYTVAEGLRGIDLASEIARRGARSRWRRARPSTTRYRRARRSPRPTHTAWSTVTSS